MILNKVKETIKIISSPYYIRIKWLALNDQFGLGLSKPKSDRVHLDAAIHWLCNAQDAIPNDYGVSHSYNLLNGWTSSYPETTGYIIPTLFDFSNLSGNEKIRDRALRMANWLTEIQMDCGAIQGGTIDAREKKPVVFNTGQVILGWTRSFIESKEKKYLKAIIKAADWIVKVQDKDGAWRKYAPSANINQVNTYNTRVAWGLLRVYEITENKKYLNAAKLNIDWALTQQHDNGWFKNNDFYDNNRPLLHTIAYAIRGILEVGIFMKNSQYKEKAKLAADSILRITKKNGFIPGRLNSNWKGAVTWSCLTGSAQTALCWLTLTQHYGSERKKYLFYSQKIINYLKARQSLIANYPGILGGIKGAYPVSGKYAPFQFPNWATKFFADLLMAQHKIQKNSNCNQLTP